MKIIKFCLSIIICLSVGFVGSFFTMSSISSWYTSINKPLFNPPNWLFGPVWTMLYVLMGIALYMVWSEGLERKDVRAAMSVFAVQLVLNGLWSYLFFGLKSPLIGLIGIVILWFMIALTIYFFHRVSANAAFLLVPYILWVSFATLLNFEIWRLNR